MEEAAQLLHPTHRKMKLKIQRMQILRTCIHIAVSEFGIKTTTNMVRLYAIHTSKNQIPYFQKKKKKTIKLLMSKINLAKAL